MITPAMGLTGNILKTLRQFKRPLSLDEIAFRVRYQESSVQELLSRLARANIVFKDGDNYLLNRDRSQHDLKKLLD